MSVTCKCGMRREGFGDRVEAEVFADAHEAVNVRRSYRHDAVVVEEAK